MRPLLALLVGIAAVPATACAVREATVIGAWSDIAAASERSEPFPAGDAYEIVLERDAGGRSYRTYLHHRPDGAGRWSFARCRLSLIAQAGDRETFTVVAASRRRLVLRPLSSRTLQRFRRIE